VGHYVDRFSWQNNQTPHLDSLHLSAAEIEIKLNYTNGVFHEIVQIRQTIPGDNILWSGRLPKIVGSAEIHSDHRSHIVQSWNLGGYCHRPLFKKMALQLCRQLVVGQASEPFFGFLCWIACRINLRLLGFYITTQVIFVSAMFMNIWAQLYSILVKPSFGIFDIRALWRSGLSGHRCHMGTAIKCDVPDLVKPPFQSINPSSNQSKKQRLGGDLSSRTIASYTGDSQLMSSKYSGKAPSVQ